MLIWNKNYCLKWYFWMFTFCLLFYKNTWSLHFIRIISDNFQFKITLNYISTKMYLLGDIIYKIWIKLFFKEYFNKHSIFIFKVMINLITANYIVPKIFQNNKFIWHVSQLKKTLTALILCFVDGTNYSKFILKI